MCPASTSFAGLADAAGTGGASPALGFFTTLAPAPQPGAGMREPGASEKPAQLNGTFSPRGGLEQDREKTHGKFHVKRGIARLNVTVLNVPLEASCAGARKVEKVVQHRQVPHEAGIWQEVI